MFLVKSTYEDIVQLDSSTAVPWRVTWRWEGPQCIRAFFWLICNRGVMSEERVRRHIADDSSCPLCQVTVESTLHMLRDCAWARRVWENLLNQEQQVSFFDSSLDVTQGVVLNLRSKCCHSNGSKWSVIFGTCVWLLWKGRNDYAFSGVRIQVLEMANRVLKQARFYEDALRKGAWNLE